MGARHSLSKRVAHDLRAIFFPATLLRWVTAPHCGDVGGRPLTVEPHSTATSRKRGPLDFRLFIAIGGGTISVDYV